MRLEIYYTDALVFVLLLFGIGLILFNRNSVLMKRISQKICSRSRYIITSLVLLAFILIGMLDSIHYKQDPESPIVISVLDRLLSPQNSQNETTYSAPFALKSYVPELIKNESGKMEEIYPALDFAGQNLKDPNQDRASDILHRLGKGMLWGIMLSAILFILFNSFLKKHLKKPLRYSFWFTLACLICLVSISAQLMFEYHILGTDKVGRDVFYLSIKSIRTGLIIGSLTTLIMLPFALLFGMLAGYFPGWIDDSIQYIYITLSSIPAILLIAAAVVSLQTKIEGNPDLKLLLLCMILGLTSWTSLCRYVRGETLKLRDSEFVQSAITLGVNKVTILWRHILPNLMHIVVITLVLDFSGLVLAEAVLTYIGVGVDTATYSWGTMINAARLEMARDPIVWWSLIGALVLMFSLVFSANIFSEAIQDALSPRRE